MLIKGNITYNPETNLKLTSTTRSFAVIDQPDQVSAILSDEEMPMLPLFVGDIRLLRRNRADDLLEIAERQPGEESESDQDDLENLVRKRQDGGRKFERVNDKSVAPLLPAIKPVAAPPAVPVPPGPAVPFLVPVNHAVNATFDKDGLEGSSC